MSNFDKKIKYFGDEIELRKLLAVLLLNKKFIMVITSIYAIFSILYSISLSNIYTAETILRPTSQNSSSLMGQYSGLASFAGINVPAGNGDDIGVALAMVKSKKLISQLMMKETFLANLMAAKSWNMQNNLLIYDAKIFDQDKKQWTRKVSLPFGKIPSSQEAILVFNNHVSVSQDKKNNLVTLRVRHISPEVAQQWSLWIVQEVNGLLANLKAKESQASIDYLNNQIKVTPYAELRTMFYELIQETTQSMMLAKVNVEYALTTIDPPLVPEIKSGPKRALICILGTLLGGMLSILTILIRHLVFKKDDEFNFFI